MFQYGAGNGTRTRDIHLGKVTLYQLSYTRNVISLYSVISYLGRDSNPHVRLKTLAPQASAYTLIPPPR